jgi:hypothetical protein
MFLTELKNNSFLFKGKPYLKSKMSKILYRCNNCERCYDSEDKASRCCPKFFHTITQFENKNERFTTKIF